MPVATRDAAKKLSWSDIGLIHEQGIWATNEFYKPAEKYWRNKNDEVGIELALVQQFPGAERGEWHLNQDVVFALNLLREGDSWVRPSEDYIEVARLRRNPDGRPIALEMRNEHLRDYLCARGHILRVASYRARDVIVADPAEAGSPQEKNEAKDGERFELRIYPVLEGGMVGGSYAVLNVSRTDVDSEEDVPLPGPETNDNVEVKRWQGEHTGKEYFRIEGELWRDEEIDPAPHSLRVRRDSVPTGINYIVDATGARLTSEELDDEDIARWLWFKPAVVPELLTHRGTAFRWYTAETGGVSCGPGSLTHFGLNGVGIVTVYAYDIAKLELWQQRIWAGYNAAPEGGVSKELLSSQMRAQPAKTKAPEQIFAELINKIDPLFVAEIGSPLFRSHPGTDKLQISISRFRALEPDGLFALAKDIMRLIADRIDAAALQKIVPPPPKERWGTLKSLEKYLATVGVPEDAHDAMAPLFGTYELRLADAHLAPGDLANSLKRVGIDPQAMPLDQGYSMIENVAKAIWRVGAIIHRQLRNDQDGGSVPSAS